MFSPKFTITPEILKNIGAIEAAKAVLEKYPSSPFLPPPGVVKKKICQQIDQEKNICLKEREEWFLEERHE